MRVRWARTLGRPCARDVTGASSRAPFVARRHCCVIAGYHHRMGPSAYARVLLPALAAASLRAQAASDVAAAFVRTHCVECHGGDTTKGKLDLTRPAGDAVAELWRWTRLAERVRAGEMPPAGAEPPSGEQRAAFAAAVADKLRAEVPL